MTHPNGEFMVGHLRHRQINADSWTGRGLDVEAIFSLVQLETNVEMHCGTEESSSVPWRESLSYLGSRMVRLLSC
ncbi:hypothetical protein JG688_00011466 [Phytophthora aleatoria]|uniref:Uncharacterized protein n=1 Tax=Phytophthora aleatoria TaxID=2496075 RepID=A0A8J5M589_9STRA|nr:hypothetical protein JG688_00011466 [Phytophthora aleatoria]